MSDTLLEQALQGKVAEFKALMNRDIDDLPIHPAGQVSHYSKEKIEELILYHTIENKASDLLLKTQETPKARIRNEWRNIGMKELDENNIKAMIDAVYNGNTWTTPLSRAEGIDAVYTINKTVVGGIGKIFRFRANITKCLAPEGREGIEIILRPIGSLPNKMDYRDTPLELVQPFLQDTGLIFVVGPTGSGKTNFLGTMILELLYQTYKSTRIVSLEQPVEFDYSDVPQEFNQITQIAVPQMVASFSEGLKNGMRKAPNHIFVGETRDSATARAVLEASKSGHLVYTTMHVNDVPTILGRYCDLLGSESRNSVFAESLEFTRLMLSQRLRKHKNGSHRYPVREYLIPTGGMFNELIESQDFDNTIPFIREKLKKHGVPFVVHARQRVLEGAMDEREFEHSFLSEWRDFPVNQIDERIHELKYKELNPMFQNNPI